MAARPPVVMYMYRDRQVYMILVLPIHWNPSNDHNPSHQTILELVLPHVHPIYSTVPLTNFKQPNWLVHR